MQVVNIPLQNDFETELSATISAVALTFDIEDAPGFALPVGQAVYAVIEPLSSTNREVVLITGISGTTLTVTRGLADYSGGATTAATHSGGSTFVITDTWQIFDEYATAINSKLDNDGGNSTTSLDIAVTGTSVRIREDSGELKLTDDLTAEVSLSTLAAAAGVDTQVRVSVADTTSNFLDNKITVSGTGLVVTKSITSPGGDEKLNIDVTSTAEDASVDNSYTASETIVAGAPVSATSTDDEAENMIISTLSDAGTESTFSAQAVGHIKTCNAGENKVAAIYYYGTTIELVVGTVAADKTITWGTAVNVGTGAALGIERIEDDKVAILYADNAGTPVAWVVIVTISGTVPTLGTPSSLGAVAPSTNNADIALIDTDKLVVAYSDGIDASKGKARCATFTGTTIGTWGAALEFETGATKYVSVSKFDTDKAGVFYQDDDDSDKGKGALLVATGTTLAAAAAVEMNTNATTYITSAQTTTNKIVVGYYDSTSTDVEARVASLSGLTISYGVEATVGSSASAYLSVDSISATEAFIAYEETGTSDGKFNKLSVSGTTITVSDQYTINGSTNNVSYISLAKVSDKSKFIICYRDEADANKGNAEVYQEYDNVDASVGFAQSSVSATDSVLVRSKGVDANQTGLTAGTVYYLKSGGIESTNNTGYKGGVAKSTTELDIDIDKDNGISGTTTATGANLTTLTDGSDADSLHTHPSYTPVTNLGNGTRAASTASGTEVIAHGLGRTPKQILFFSVVGGYGNSSGCVDDDMDNVCSYIDTAGGASVASSVCMRGGSGGNLQSAEVTDWDDTNFTLAWTKAGTGGTLTFSWIALG